MVNSNWLKDRLEEIKDEKNQRLISQGKNPYWSPEGKGTYTLKLFIDKKTERRMNSFQQPVFDWRLVEPLGYVWPTSEATDAKIMKAISGFSQLPPEDLPPFVVVKVEYDPLAAKKDIYKVTLA